MAAIVVMILATWRLSSLIAQEQGPFDVFARLRLLSGVWYDEAREPHGDNAMAKAITCVWCSSVWIGLVMAVAYKYAPEVAFWVALPFALSAGAVIVNGVVEWHEQTQSRF